MDSTNWLAILEQTQIQKVMESNQYTEQYGLTRAHRMRKFWRRSGKAH